MGVDLNVKVITGFHAIEERIRETIRFSKENIPSLCIYYTNPGPRVKKILKTAEEAGIKAVNSPVSELDKKVLPLPETARDHRGIVLEIESDNVQVQNLVDFDQWLASYAVKKEDVSDLTVVILDSVTDPHNVGAVIRSADQFGVSLVIVPERRGINNVIDNEIIARTSAGSSAWVKLAVVPNLVRAVEQLKNIGFWIYGADADGESLSRMKFASRTAIVMGSEGTGISRLLGKNCDSIVSIPTCGKIDSLNVSVAAGVIMYEVYRQKL